jgi:hypothetical protein
VSFLFIFLSTAAAGELPHCRGMQGEKEKEVLVAGAGVLSRQVF